MFKGSYMVILTNKFPPGSSPHSSTGRNPPNPNWPTKNIRVLSNKHPKASEKAFVGVCLLFSHRFGEGKHHMSPPTPPIRIRPISIRDSMSSDTPRAIDAPVPTKAANGHSAWSEGRRSIRRSPVFRSGLAGWGTHPVPRREHKNCRENLLEWARTTGIWRPFRLF